MHATTHRWARILGTGVSGWLIVSAARTALAADYYIAPSGSDQAAGTQAAPWSTFAHAMGVLKPSDTLWLEDGTYTPANNPGQGAVLDVTVAGTAGSPITFRALHEGKAIVDGQQSVECGKAYQDYVEIVGINFRDSGGNGSNWGHGVELGGNGSALRRCIVNGFGYNDPSASAGENNCAGIEVGGTNDVVEDCAVYVNADMSPRLGINSWASNSVFRRNFVLWQPGGNPVGPGNIQIYGQSNNVAENNVIANGIGGADGIIVWVNTYNGTASHNLVYGNVVENTSIWGIWTATQANGSDQVTGTMVQDNVLMGCGDGLRNGGDNAQTMTNNTVVGVGSNGISVVSMQQSGYPGSYVLNTTATNNSIVGAMGGIAAWGNYVGTTSEDYNNVYGSSPAGTAGAHDMAVSPGYDTATYGNGAYLMPPAPLKGKGAGGADVGATVLYEVQGGKPTGSPLWPWPMEDRVAAELGVSVTWVDDGKGHTGGIWKTLDGVYPAGVDAGAAPDAGHAAPDGGGTASADGGATASGGGSMSDAGAGPTVDAGGAAADAAAGDNASAPGPSAGAGCGCIATGDGGPATGGGLFALLAAAACVLRGRSARRST